jgi:hypothetical protein
VKKNSFRIGNGYVMTSSEEAQHVDIPGLDGIGPAVREFIDLKKQIQAAKEQIKLISQRADELEPELRAKMKAANIKGFTTSEGNVRLYESKTAKAPSKEDLADMISERVGNDSLAQDIIGIIYDKTNRTAVQKEKIKLIPRRR